MRPLILISSLLLLAGCDVFAKQTPPMANSGEAHRQAYFDAVDRVPTHTGEDLPYHERAQIWNDNRR